MERGIGQLKRRFHVLHGEVRLDPTKTSKLVYVCAMLHNLCKARNIPLPDDADDHQHHSDGEEGEGEHNAGNVAMVNPVGPARTVTQMRDAFANLHFK